MMKGVMDPPYTCIVVSRDPGQAPTPSPRVCAHVYHINFNVAGSMHVDVHMRLPACVFRISYIYYSFLHVQLSIFNCKDSCMVLASEIIFMLKCSSRYVQGGGYFS